MSARVKVSPSILSADFARLGEEVRAMSAAGADFIHCDVMDGHFVPNLTFGPDVVKAITPHAGVPLDVHLMITPVDPFIERFVNAGAHLLTFQVEAGPHPHRTIQAIRKAGARPGVSLNPGTPVEEVDFLLEEVDLVLVMSVNPGFGGQSFIDGATRKIAAIAERVARRGLSVEIEVDGGVKPETPDDPRDTARECRDAGATILVAGSAAFKGGPEHYAANIAALRGGP